MQFYYFQGFLRCGCLACNINITNLIIMQTKQCILMLTVFKIKIKVIKKISYFLFKFTLSKCKSDLASGIRTSGINVYIR